MDRTGSRDRLSNSDMELEVVSPDAKRPRKSGGAKKKKKKSKKSISEGSSDESLETSPVEQIGSLMGCAMASLVNMKGVIQVMTMSKYQGCLESIADTLAYWLTNINEVLNDMDDGSVHSAERSRAGKRGIAQLRAYLRRLSRRQRMQLRT